MVTMSHFRDNLKAVIDVYENEEGLDGLETVTITLNINVDTLKAFLKGNLCNFDIDGWDSYRDHSSHIDICTGLFKKY